MKLIIITGASKGLGKSLMDLSLENNYTVLSISRSKIKVKDNHFHISHDLSNPKGFENKLDKFLSLTDIKKIKSVSLVNNAAVIEPIGDIKNFSHSDYNSIMNVNMLTPMLLTSWLLKKFDKRKIPITIANISSGAAFIPLVNWSLYCSTKSGLKMFTDCLMLDYQTKTNIKAFSFSPGVMDTKMQLTIRNQKKSNFKNLNKFRELKQKNLLLSPDSVSEGLFYLLASPNKIKNLHYDIRDMLNDKKISSSFSKRKSIK